MGCYDEEKNRWLTVTKVAIGLDEETLASLQSPLMNNMKKISQDSNLVPTWMRCTKTMVPDFVAKNPKEQPVWEIAGVYVPIKFIHSSLGSNSKTFMTGSEFTQAAIHTADGISIRFPKVTKIRDDKCWETATNFKELKLLYENSKISKDYSYLFKSDTNAPGCSKDEENDDLFDCPDLENKIESGIIQSNLKRKHGADEEIHVKNKLTLNNNKVSREIGIHEPKKPLPDLFLNKTIFFCMDKQEEKLNPEIKKHKRFWVAYGGNLDSTEDGSQANYVIHLNETITIEDYEKLKLNYNFSKTARHVHISWLKNSIQSKTLLDSRIFIVSLS